MGINFQIVDCQLIYHVCYARLTMVNSLKKKDKLKKGLQYVQSQQKNIRTTSLMSLNKQIFVICWVVLLHLPLIHR